MLPIGTTIYFYNDRDSGFYMGVIERHIPYYSYYVLSGCSSIDGLFNYYNSTYIKKQDAFITLDAAKKDRMLRILKKAH